MLGAGSRWWGLVILRLGSPVPIEVAKVTLEKYLSLKPNPSKGKLNYPSTTTVRMFCVFSAYDPVVTMGAHLCSKMYVIFRVFILL